MEKQFTNITLENDCLYVQGELTFKTVVSLLEKSKPLLKSLNQWMFNFSQVTKVDSAALALLLEWLRESKQQKKVIFFHELPSQLLSIAKVAEIDHIISC